MANPRWNSESACSRCPASAQLRALIHVRLPGLKTDPLRAGLEGDVARRQIQRLLIKRQRGVPIFSVLGLLRQFVQLLAFAIEGIHAAGKDQQKRGHQGDDRT